MKETNYRGLESMTRGGVNKDTNGFWNFGGKTRLFNVWLECGHPLPIKFKWKEGRTAAPVADFTKRRFAPHQPCTVFIWRRGLLIQDCFYVRLKPCWEACFRENPNMRGWRRNLKSGLKACWCRNATWDIHTSDLEVRLSLHWFFRLENQWFQGV